MATQVGNVHLDTRVLDKITAEMRPKAQAVIKETAFAIEADAKTLAPVDTGALRGSINTEVHDLTGIVQDGVEYGIFQELGTSKMAAQPFLVPALEKRTAEFLKAFEGLFK